MVRAAVSLCGIELDNPVIPASGTFGYGYTFAELYDIDCLGTFSFKGTTREQRLGNAQPRIAEAPGGMLNAVGLQNPGVDAVIAEELPRLKQVFHKPVMANVSGFSIEEYVEVCRKLDACEQVGWLEVNISCPNVHGGGLAFGTDPKAAASVTRAVKGCGQKARYCEAFSECHKHCGYRQGVRRRGRGRGELNQHGAWHAHRPAREAAAAGKQNGRHVRSSNFSACRADGLAGL